MVPFGENEISRAYDEIGLTLLLLVATGVAINHVFDSQLFALTSEAGNRSVYIIW